MTKRYTSATVLSFNVMLHGKHKIHLRFDAFSGKGSVYVTSDPAMQEALESHHLFNKAFILESEYDEKPEEVETTAEEKKSGKTYEVSSIQEAKDILVGEYSISRTKLRSKEAILNTAQSLGIEFSGLEN